MKRTTSKNYGNASLLDYFTKAIEKMPKCAEYADGPEPPDSSDAPMEQSTSSTVGVECVAQDTETESESNMRQEQEQNADENVFHFHGNDFGFSLSEKQLSDAEKYRFLTAFCTPPDSYDWLRASRTDRGKIISCKLRRTELLNHHCFALSLKMGGVFFAHTVHSLHQRR